MSAQMICILIAAGLTALDLLFADKAFRKGNAIGRSLGLTCIMAALVVVSYVISILVRGHFAFSFFSSIYFISIDAVLNSLLLFTAYFTDLPRGHWLWRAFRSSGIVMLADSLVFLLNPFWEISVRFLPRNTLIAHYEFDMLPLYYFHLTYTYLLVVAVVVLLVYKCCIIPKEYRNKYQFVIFTLIVIVAVNAVFLYLPMDSVWNLLDYSLVIYSAAVALIYWGAFVYPERGMLNQFRNTIFESVDQGIVLFDYSGRSILFNSKAKQLMPGIALRFGIKVDSFLKTLDISLSGNVKDNRYSFQCYIHTEEGHHPLRCDYQRLLNKRGKTLGQLFVLTDAGAQTDHLTGFHNWDSFERLAKENPENYGFPTTVLVSDINNLLMINRARGKDAGDRLISELAGLLRDHFPKESFYVRGQEATLIVLGYQTSEAEMNAKIEEMRAGFNGDFQYAISTATEEDGTVLPAISRAERAMRARKLMDTKSGHSTLINSLLQAMQEWDSDTKNHVERTQKMSAALGRKIGLSDEQMGLLSLLCILHDIGKIGIPLDVLNKPGKLSEEEKQVLKSHAEKGYQIAMSSPDLICVAEMIRHHHERWDGFGYPDGLSRESIPFLSRVISVVDAYDAMIHNRTYRAAMSEEKAQEELRCCAGTQFDPAIVAAFLQVVQEEQYPADVPAEMTERSGSVSPNGRDISISHDFSEDSMREVKFSRYMVEEDMTISGIDESFTALTGYTEEDVRSRNLHQIDLLPPEDKDAYLLLVSEKLAKMQMAYIEHRVVRKDGSLIYVVCYGRQFFDPVTRTMRSEIVLTDCADTHTVKQFMNAEQSKAKARLARWEKTYRRDSLTELLNHAAFVSDIEQVLLTEETPVMMLMIDADKFKKHNDTYGHRAGDEHLILLSQALSAAIRERDIACRMGGDEFAAVIRFGVKMDEAKMYERGRQIFAKINSTIQASQYGGSVSVGAAISAKGDHFNSLYERADKALYRSKSMGGGYYSTQADL